MCVDNRIKNKEENEYKGEVGGFLVGREVRGRRLWVWLDF